MVAFETIYVEQVENRIAVFQKHGISAGAEDRPGVRTLMARLLATKEPRRPRQASLRRGVLASYYALFHLLVDAAARRLVSGNDRQELRNCLSRAFDHGVMKRVARQFAERNVSPKLSPRLNGLPLQDEIVRVAAEFVDLQQHRHEADYNMGRRFTRLEGSASSATPSAPSSTGERCAIRSRPIPS